MAAGQRRVRRARDRHDRGLRGPLAPPDVPLSRSRSQRFDDVVLEAVEHLEDRWSAQLAGVEFAVVEVPPADALSADGPGRGGDPVPLGRVIPAAGDEPARVVIYRRPIEARATVRAALLDLVHDVVVDQVATLLGLDPEVVDPPYDEDD